MAYQRLTPQQEEQVRSMRRDGKSPDEVVAFFKATYSIKLPKWKVSYIAGKKDGGPRRKYSRKAVAEQTTDDNIIKLVDQLRMELEAYSKFVIKKIRIELVKAIAEARKKRIDVGEDVEEIKESEE